MMDIMEEKMKEETPITNQASDQVKKVYIKPALNKIQLVAGEAVLATCKNGDKTICFPSPICDIRVARS